MSADRLFDDAPVQPTKPAKQKRVKSKPEPESAAGKRVLAAYHAGFLARHGCKPLIAGARDMKLIKQMIATWDERIVLALIERFFESSDQRVRSSDYKVPDLFYHAQRLLLELNGRVTDRRTLEISDTVSRATRRRS